MKYTAVLLLKLYWAASPSIDIVAAVDPFQVCAGMLSACEAAVLDVQSQYLDPETEAILFMDASKGRLILHLAYGKPIARPLRVGLPVPEIVELRSTFPQRDAFPVREMKYGLALLRLVLLIDRQRFITFFLCVLPYPQSSTTHTELQYRCFYQVVTGSCLERLLARAILRPWHCLRWPLGL